MVFIDRILGTEMEIVLNTNLERLDLISFGSILDIGMQNHTNMYLGYPNIKENQIYQSKPPLLVNQARRDLEDSGSMRRGSH